ncbi:MAG: methyltransferase domain-containing protein [bacterium]
MALDKEQVRDLYRRRARGYDFLANLYYLIGFRETRYRKMAVKDLALSRGDTVIELGCGTGLNFRFLRDAVGEEGRIIGVDLSVPMLARARERLGRHGWGNVELVQADIATYSFPGSADGILSVLALSLVPQYEEVVARAAQDLRTDGKLVIADLKKPEWSPAWLTRIGVWITRPFGITPDLVQRKPWEAMKNTFQKVRIRELYGGFFYIASAQR